MTRCKALLGLLTVLLVAACDDDVSGIEGDVMDVAEANFLASDFAALQESSRIALIAHIAAAGEGDGPDRVVSCPGSGQIDLEYRGISSGLSRDPESQEVIHVVEMDATADVTPVTCDFEGGLTVEGDPALSMTIAVEREAPLEWVFDLSGPIRWSAEDGRSGGCEVDLHTTTNVETSVMIVTGRLCGQAIDQNSAGE